MREWLNRFLTVGVLAAFFMLMVLNAQVLLTQNVAAADREPSPSPKLQVKGWVFQGWTDEKEGVFHCQVVTSTFDQCTNCSLFEVRAVDPDG